MAVGDSPPRRPIIPPIRIGLLNMGLGKMAVVLSKTEVVGRVAPVVMTLEGMVPTGSMIFTLSVWVGRLLPVPVGWRPPVAGPRLVLMIRSPLSKRSWMFWLKITYWRALRVADRSTCNWERFAPTGMPCIGQTPQG